MNVLFEGRHDAREAITMGVGRILYDSQVRNLEKKAQQYQRQQLTHPPEHRRRADSQNPYGRTVPHRGTVRITSLRCLVTMPDSGPPRAN